MAFEFNSDSQQQVPDLPPPQESVSWFYLGIILTFGIVIAVFFGWNPAANAFRAMLARQDAAAAQDAIFAEDWSRAGQHLFHARRRAPNDVAVLRAMVAFYQATGADPAGLAQQLRLLSEQQPLSTEEELQLGNALIAAGKTVEAREVYEKLPASTSTPQPGLKLLSSILKAEGHTQEAAVIERRANAQTTDSPADQLIATLADLSSNFFEVRQQARKQLWQLAKLNTTTGLDAIAKLATDRTLTRQEGQHLLELVSQHPLEHLPARLGVISAQLRLQPEQRAAMVNAEIERFKTRKAGRLEDLAYWLMVEQEHAQVCQLIPQDLATKSPTLYPILMQTLAQQQRWEELKVLLTIPQPPVPKALLNLALAEVHAHLEPDLQMTRQLLQGSLDSAKLEGSLSTLQTIATLAEKLNLAEIALQASLQAGSIAATAGMTTTALQSLQKSLQLATLIKDSGALLNVARKLHELSPGSAVFADRLTYLRLILGSELELVDLATLDRSRTELTASSEHIPPSLLHALAAYRFGDSAAVRKHLADLKNVTTLPAGQRAVAAGLLAMAGEAARAWQIAEKVPSTLLLAEELAFLKRVL